jgi:hypothetical protein
VNIIIQNNGSSSIGMNNALVSGFNGEAAQHQNKPTNPAQPRCQLAREEQYQRNSQALALL